MKARETIEFKRVLPVYQMFATVAVAYFLIGWSEQEWRAGNRKKVMAAWLLFVYASFFIKSLWR